jgi:alpha-glucosidase
MALLPVHDQVVAFTRGEGADRLLCAFNLSDRPARLAHGLPGTWQAVDGHGFGGRIDGGEIVLEPQEAVFAKR